MGLLESSGDDGSIEVEVSAGKKLTCLVCAHGQFRKRPALLNTRAATFFKLDWANASAATYVCTKCGYVHWFLNS